MIVPFPIAFFTATLACDLAFWASANPLWVTATIWLLGAGIIMALLAALGGVTDLLGDSRIRALAAVWWHFVGNLVLVVIEAGNWVLRYRSDAVLPWGLVLSVIAVGLVLFTGWKGWEMVYRHRVGIAESNSEEPVVSGVPGSDRDRDRDRRSRMA